MDAVTKVSGYLGIDERFLKVREWSKVYWVHVSGKRPTLLSKKLVDRAAQIRVGYTIAGDALVKDEVSGKCYILRSPGFYTREVWAIKEIKNPGLYSDFATTSGKSFEGRYTQKPSTVRELMVFKAVNNKGAA